jgi:hypothetical protein
MKAKTSELRQIFGTEQKLSEFRQILQVWTNFSIEMRKNYGIDAISWKSG